MRASGNSARIVIVASTPVHVRHLEVHQGDVGAEAAELFDRFAAVGGLADERDVGFVSDERRDTFPQERVVVDREHANPDGVGAHSVGSRMARKARL